MLTVEVGAAGVERLQLTKLRYRDAIATVHIARRLPACGRPLALQQVRPCPTMPLLAGRRRIVGSPWMGFVVLGLTVYFLTTAWAPVLAPGRTGLATARRPRCAGPVPGRATEDEPARPPRNIGGIASRLAPTRTAPPMTAVSTSTPPAERRPAGCARCGRAEVERPHRTVAGGVATPGVPRHWLPSRPVHWSWRTRRTRRARPGSRDQAPAPFKRGKTAVEQVSSKHRQVAGPAAPFCPSGAARHSARAERHRTLPRRTATAPARPEQGQHAIRPGTDRWNGIVDVEGRGRERSVDRVCGSHGPPPPRVPARAAD